MTLNSIVKKAAFNQKILLEKLDASDQARKFIERFRSKYVSTDLVRLGGDNDGGYLLPDNFEDLSYCFSPGVDFTANFEHELSKKHGIKSFMADASVKASPIQDDNLSFVPKFLGSRSAGNFITLSDWVEQSVGKDTGHRILQMDIEGGEYDVLTYESSDTLAQFTTMIIEFHWVEKLFRSDFLQMFSAIFEKIYVNFSICHVHPNNCCGIAKLDGLEVPRCMEVTFIRNDILDAFKNENQVSLPHELDMACISNSADIEMPKIWWKSVE
jgi:hypothetical protein